jgi:dipeptidase
MKLKAIFLSLLFVLPYFQGNSCTNFLVTKGASYDGSTMISYSADSHVLYGELYHYPAAKYKKGTMLDIYEWDTGTYLGKIKQVRETYNVVGNMNEFQVSIGETTYGGRSELKHQEGAIMDYGSLMYIALQRSKTAREAIKVIVELMDEYGYYSKGESFSVADPNEVWIFEMIGKGDGEKGAVWVARMIPDGYICGHANQARIRTFPQKNENHSTDKIKDILNKEITTVYAEDVISFARKKGYFNGKDKDFSFSDTYAPIDFGAARFCEARVWSIFRKYDPSLDEYLDHVMGDDPENRFPLWIKPKKKVSLRDMMEFMRDHFQGTPLDMTQDAGAGPFKVPYRWRPLTWEVEGQKYCNERAVATQQTGFSFVSQMRSWLPDPIGGIHWWGVDDAGSTVYTPMYCSMTRAPESFAVGNGSMMEFSDDAAFWVFNQVTNLAYTRYSLIHPEIKEKQLEMENSYILNTSKIDEQALALMSGKKAGNKVVDFLSDYSVNAGNETVSEWKKFYGYLFARFMDGNVKEVDPGKQNPKLLQPGYDESYYRAIIEDAGEKLKVRKSEPH